MTFLRSGRLPFDSDFLYFQQIQEVVRDAKCHDITSGHGETTGVK